MAAGTQVTTLSDYRTDILNRVRDATGVSATNTIVDRYINMALADMHLQDDFPWSVRDALLVTQPTYTTGTVTITQGSTTLTGSGTAWNTANVFSINNTRAGGKFKIGSIADVYEVSSVGSDTAITLRSAFTGDDVSGESYTYFEDEYTLASDFFRLVDKRTFANAIRIACIGDREFFRRYVRNDITGCPRVATIIEKTPTSGTTARLQRVVLHPPPDKAYTVPYRYITTNLALDSTGAAQTQMTADTDEPIIPLRYRHVLTFHALYHYYRDRKDDQRSQEAKAEYVDLVRRITQDTGPTTNTARIVRRKIRIPANRASIGRYVTGTYWDQLLDDPDV